MHEFTCVEIVHFLRQFVQRIQEEGWNESLGKNCRKYSRKEGGRKGDGQVAESKCAKKKKAFLKNKRSNQHMVPDVQHEPPPKIKLAHKLRQEETAGNGTTRSTAAVLRERVQKKEQQRFAA